MVHSDTSTPSERQAQALLDEAMGRPAAATDAGIQAPATTTITTTATAAAATPAPAPGPTPAEHAVADANRARAAGLVDRANERVGGWARTADAALGAPVELRGAEAAREREEISARTPLQAAADTLAHAKEFLRWV